MMKIIKNSSFLRICWLLVDFSLIFSLANYFDIGNSKNHNFIVFLPFFLAWTYFIFWNKLYEVLIKFMFLFLGLYFGIFYQYRTFIASVKSLIIDFNMDFSIYLLMMLVIILINWFLGKIICIIFKRYKNENYKK